MTSLRSVAIADLELAGLGYESRWVKDWQAFHILYAETGTCVATAESVDTAVNYLRHVEADTGKLPTRRLPGMPCPVCTSGGTPI